MMKPVKLTLFLMLFVSLSASAQTDKLPKIRYTNGFFSTKYEIGDKDADAKAVQLHLEKTNNDAYYQFRRARSLDNQSLVWMTLGTVGALIGVFSSDANYSITGYGVALVSYGIALGTGISANHKYERAVNIYNKAAGY